MNDKRALKIWLYSGLIMVFVQVVVGGITRLTGSGLSITKWEIITGVVPPLSKDQWTKEFEMYKETPQYREINEGMELGSILKSGTFKFIYFWEWVHRQWARLMGLVFIFPFLYFLYRKQLSKNLLIRLIVLLLLSAAAASLGWIMVSSGLIDRPWVNAYKLSIHLILAFIVFIYLWWTILLEFEERRRWVDHVDLRWIRNGFLFFLILLWIQIFFGGIMSGMKAAVVYPTWPDMNSEFFPQVLFNINNLSVDNFIKYDQNEWMPAFVHFIHRSIAYVLLILGSILFYLSICKSFLNQIAGKWMLWIIVLITQVILGIITVVLSKGSIPILFGVLHQAVALALLTVTYYLQFILNKKI
ncbi:MAG TPA: COX15/CtaA family protein [Saprospiraceae bacterium]|nr:COX15/CtaA family protein [Saprospiraceae bacterium]